MTSHRVATPDLPTSAAQSPFCSGSPATHSRPFCLVASVGRLLPDSLVGLQRGCPPEPCRAQGARVRGARTGGGTWWESWVPKCPGVSAEIEGKKETSCLGLRQCWGRRPFTQLKPERGTAHRIQWTWEAAHAPDTKQPRRGDAWRV